MANGFLYAGIVDRIIMKRGRKYWYWKLVAKNGEVLATSEVYSSKAKCLKTARKIREQLHGGASLVVQERKR